MYRRVILKKYQNSWSKDSHSNFNSLKTFYFISFIFATRAPFWLSYLVFLWVKHRVRLYLYNSHWRGKEFLTMDSFKKNWLLPETCPRYVDLKCGVEWFKSNFYLMLTYWVPNEYGVSTMEIRNTRLLQKK